jgi:hypothetical protein
LRLPIVVGSDSPGFKEVVVAYRVTGPETDSTDQVEGRIYFHDPAAAAPTPAADDGGADGRADAQTD